jgi:hypothetical protein
MSKQTAVEWLSERLIRMIPTINPIYKKDIDTYLQQAKEMEKEQMLQFGSRVTDRWGLTKVEEHYIEDEYNKYYNQP